MSSLVEPSQPMVSATTPGLLFHALGDETRLGLVESLRLGGEQSLTELAVGLPMTRQAVTKHLDVLVDVGLVKVRKVGRQRVHELAFEPLQAVEAWLEPFSKAWDRRLGRLETYLMAGGRDDQSEE